MTVKHPGRPADVGELASAHGQELVTLAYLLTGDRDEAQDVVQTVLTRLHGTDRLSRVEHPLAYAKRAVTNEFLDRRKSWRRQRALLRRLHQERQPVTLVEEPVAERDALERAFVVLRPRERACVTLRYFSGWDDAAIAAALGCAEGTVRSLVSRALPRLRAEIEREEGQ